MDIKSAVKALRDGKIVKRLGKRSYVKPSTYYPKSHGTSMCWIGKNAGWFEAAWTPSFTDMLANDWEEYEPETGVN
jgi:hypothetical protein